jgi:excisionase family DNA binding protein
MEEKISVLYPVLYEKYNDTLTLKDLANYLDISYNTACRLLKERAILGKRVGREWRIPRHRVVDFLEKQKR